MNSFNYDYNSDGDWEDKGEFAWTERHWQDFLKKNEKETAEFLVHYIHLKQKPGHLEEIARRLGWENEVWNSIHLPLENDDGLYIEEMNYSSASVEPFSIHKHPIFIATRGIYLYLYKICEEQFKDSNISISASESWRLFGSFHGGELNALMAIHAIDVGDYALAICHLKNALTAVNFSFNLLADLLHQDDRFEPIRTGLFDLREIWLKLLQDCREVDAS